MRHDLGEELVAEFDDILGGPSVAALIPDRRFTEEAEPSPMNDARRCLERLGPKEHGGTEDPLEGGDQPPVLFACGPQKFRPSPATSFKQPP
jgi:hypothetical protein